MVVVVVIEFDDDSLGVSVGSGGFIGDVFSLVLVGFLGLYMVIDLCLIDICILWILVVISVEGGSKDFDFILVVINFGGVFVGGNLSGWLNMFKEKVLCEVIVKVVEFLELKVFIIYYCYNSDNIIVVGYKVFVLLKVIIVVVLVKVLIVLVIVLSYRMFYYEKIDLVMLWFNLVCLGYLK